MTDDYMNTLEEAEAALELGTRLSKQSSYARRMPARESHPHFAHARALLQRIVTRCPIDSNALRLMSRVCESLLDFSNAIRYQELAISATGTQSNKDLKRLAVLRGSLREWQELGLSPRQLESLGQYLEAHGVGEEQRSLELTSSWAIENELNPRDVCEGVQRRGAFSDFQVLSNLVYG